MKKVILFAAAFLVGITAQAFTNIQNDAVPGNGMYNRYNDTQEISFVEDGILFTVATNGHFYFSKIGQENYTATRYRTRYRTRNRANSHQVNYRPNRRNNSYRRYYKRTRNLFVKKDRYGKIIKVGNTPIYYKQNGKVKHIGLINLKYQRGRLIQVGNMEITYNRFGDIRDTFGFINRYNTFWHDDCNLNTEDHWQQHHIPNHDARHDRKRKKRIRTH